MSGAPKEFPNEAVSDSHPVTPSREAQQLQRINRTIIGVAVVLGLLLVAGFTLFELRLRHVEAELRTTLKSQLSNVSCSDGATCVNQTPCSGGYCDLSKHKCVWTGC
jgi:hypothetical protein